MQASQDGELPDPRKPLSLSPSNGGSVTAAESSTIRNSASRSIMSSEELPGSDEAVSPDEGPIPPLPHKKKADWVKLIDKQPSPEIEEYFKKIQSSLDKLLLEEVRSHQAPDTEYEPMSTRLAMRGISDDDCVPCIVVSCQPKYKNVLEASLKKDVIMDSFLVSNTRVMAEKSAGDTFCGTPIRLRTPDRRRRDATFGGMIKVVTASGRTELLGLTCGHEVHRWDEDIGGEMSERETSPTSSRSSTVQTLLTPPTSPAAPLFQDNELLNKVSQPGYVCKEDSESDNDAVNPWDFKKPTVIGRVIDIPKDVMLRDGKLFDWALFQPTSYKMNQLPVTPSPKLEVSIQRPRYIESTSLIVLSNQPWESESCSSSRMVLGERVTDSYTVLTKGPVIRRGDEGSWIINLETFEVLSQFTRKDNSPPVSYFVPMVDILSDIKWKLGARFVQLASPDDISDWKAGLYQTLSPIDLGERVSGAVGIRPSNDKDEKTGSGVFMAAFGTCYLELRDI
ncbi:hypothetical protein GGR51DRAFT_568878 [Nemania sp. FL0031]|nr:hypothetical protein GGR51DRAFT_568878 [Nemania sp. FL0031]